MEASNLNIQSENKSKTKTKTKKNTVYTQGVPMCAESQNLQEKSLCSAIVICWIFYQTKTFLCLFLEKKKVCKK